MLIYLLGRPDHGFRISNLDLEGERTMFSRQMKIATLSILALVVVLGFAPGVVQAANVEGRITAVSVAQGTITIKPSGGRAVTLTVGSGTRIELNGHETTLSALHVGDHGDADYEAKTHMATGIDATR